MNLSNMLVQPNFVLQPFKAQVALDPFCFEVNHFQVSYGTRLHGELSLTHETSPGLELAVPGHVGIYGT